MQAYKLQKASLLLPIYHGHVTRVQVVSRQKLNCNRENIEVYRVKYDFFSIRIEFLTTNDLDPVPPVQMSLALALNLKERESYARAHVTHSNFAPKRVT